LASAAAFNQYYIIICCVSPKVLVAQIRGVHLCCLIFSGLFHDAGVTNEFSATTRHVLVIYCPRRLNKPIYSISGTGSGIVPEVDIGITAFLVESRRRQARCVKSNIERRLHPTQRATGYSPHPSKIASQ
jgi:hypothetical protein